MARRSCCSSGTILHRIAAHELSCSDDARLVNSISLDDSQQRQSTDLEVEAHGVMLHIPDIHCEFVFPTYGVSPVHLSPPRDTGKHFVTAHLERGVAFQVTNQ